jgi:transcriptional/translational regulatory protein YebC/TACO1
MAGHSKWANIKRQKARVDAVKGKIFARISREIIVAARSGVPDPLAIFNCGQLLKKPRRLIFLVKTSKGRSPKVPV